MTAVAQTGLLATIGRTPTFQLKYRLANAELNTNFTYTNSVGPIGVLSVKKKKITPPTFRTMPFKNEVLER